jgi:polyhydroxyalkanoate synthesis regulator phasin
MGFGDAFLKAFEKAQQETRADQRVRRIVEDESTSQSRSLESLRRTVKQLQARVTKLEASLKAKK